MLLAVLTGFLIAALIPLIMTQLKGRWISWILALFPAALFIYFIKLVSKIMHGENFTENTPWVDILGINFSFYVDGLSLLFALLITGIGILIVIYSWAYLANHRYLGRFYSYLFIFMISMLGLVLANNLILLFIFWELTTISSYLLIGFDHERLVARKAALQGLFVTTVGGFALLSAIILMGIKTGTYDMQTIIQGKSVSQNVFLYHVILTLILIGAFTKSAQAPFHFWLPGAMQGPTPVSAYLHSATMVKAGIYLLARLHPVFGHTKLWFVTLTAVGGLTMLTGVIKAMKQTNIKTLLAYTTITALGSLVFLLASEQEKVIKAAMIFLIAHAMYKAALFMAAGDLQYRTSTLDLKKLHGLYQTMPITFGIICIACASMSGLPPLLGYYVKELVYEANLAAPIAAHFLTVVVVFSNMMMAALGLILVIKPFFGKKPSVRVKEADPQMWFGGIFLAILTIFLSFIPKNLYRTLIASAVKAVIPVNYHQQEMNDLTLWHGLTPSFVLSLVTLLGALILYLRRNQVKTILAFLSPWFSLGPSYWYARSITGIAQLAHWQLQWLQCGLLRVYLMITLLTTTVVMYMAFFSRPIVPSIIFIPTFTGIPFFLVFLLMASALSTLWVKNYLSGLVFLGLFGMGMALVFLINGAPDVAMTQALIETLIVIVVVLNFYRQSPLPSITREGFKFSFLRATIAVSIGLLVSVLLIYITSYSFDDSNSQYFIENSLIKAHGRNIVNLILIDFRAMDTLGEILVVALAALGIYGLLHGKFDKVKQ